MAALNGKKNASLPRNCEVELTPKFSNPETIDQTGILFINIKEHVNAIEGARVSPCLIKRDCLAETLRGKWAPFKGRAAGILSMKCQRRGRDSRGYDGESGSHSESSSSSSMSDYGNDLEDVELELRRDIRDIDISDKNIHKK